MRVDMGPHEALASAACCFRAFRILCVSKVVTRTVFIPEKLKFTPTPQPAQCLELDKEITIQCSAKGREAPTIRWTKAGVLGVHRRKSNRK